MFILFFHSINHSQYCIRAKLIHLWSIEVGFICNVAGMLRANARRYLWKHNDNNASVEAVMV